MDEKNKNNTVNITLKMGTKLLLEECKSSYQKSIGHLATWDDFLKHLSEKYQKEHHV